MRSSRSLRLWFPCVALATLLLSIAGCFTDHPAHYYYPSSLEPGGKQLYAWPGRTPDGFRFLLQESFAALGDSQESAEMLYAERDRARIDALAAQSSSITFLLPMEVDPQARQTALRLIDEMSRARTNVSTHCVTIRTDLHTIETGADLHQALTREQSFHEEARPAGFGEALNGAIGKMMTLTQCANFVVVPLASGDDRFAVYGDLRVDQEQAKVVECSKAEILGLLQPRLLDPEARKLSGTWGSVDSGGHAVTLTSSPGSTFVAVFVSHDAPAERRAQCDDIAAQLCTPELAPIAIAQADTIWDWSACTSGEFVRMKMPLNADYSFLASPVRQRAILPGPSK